VASINRVMFLMSDTSLRTLSIIEPLPFGICITSVYPLRSFHHEVLFVHFHSRLRCSRAITRMGPVRRRRLYRHNPLRCWVLVCLCKQLVLPMPTRELSSTVHNPNPNLDLELSSHVWLSGHSVSRSSQSGNQGVVLARYWYSIHLHRNLGQHWPRLREWHQQR
jgi:hypothetical protein